jgi:hypothetical protein
MGRLPKPLCHECAINEKTRADMMRVSITICDIDKMDKKE